MRVRIHFYLSQKDQIKKKIQTLLRDKTRNMIEFKIQLFFLRRVVVILSILTMKKQIDVKLKKMNQCLKKNRAKHE